MGTKFLAKSLNKLLMNHIKDCLPDLKVKVNMELVRYQTELSSYGDLLYAGKSPGALLLHVITNFSQKYKVDRFASSQLNSRMPLMEN